MGSCCEGGGDIGPVMVVSTRPYGDGDLDDMPLLRRMAAEAGDCMAGGERWVDDAISVVWMEVLSLSDFD